MSIFTKFATETAAPKHAYTPEDLKVARTEAKERKAEAQVELKAAKAEAAAVRKVAREDARKEAIAKAAIHVGKASSKTLGVTATTLEVTAEVTETIAVVPTLPIVAWVTGYALAETSVAAIPATTAALGGLAATEVIAGTALATVLVAPVTPIVVACVGVPAAAYGAYKGLRALSRVSHKGAVKAHEAQVMNEAWVHLAEAEMVEVETLIWKGQD